jgi:XTP/dITP diphosphohydrolase
MIDKLIIASSNSGKVAELGEYLHPLNLVLVLKPQELEVEETGTTFIANARLKASQVAIATQAWAIADDSGLEVAALDGAPGIFSARYADTDANRIKRLLTELGDRPDRQAQFICAIALASPDGKIVAEAVGICKGEILSAARGQNGFGYDPVFYVPDHNLTFAEMSAALKSQISHRAQAMQILIPQLQILGLRATE